MIEIMESSDATLVFIHQYSDFADTQRIGCRKGGGGE